jgi:hypothetical protein
MTTPEERRELYIRNAMGIIEEHGWMIQGVFPVEETPENERYPFAYTVGLAARDLPELIVFGLPQDVAHTILNDLADRQCSSGDGGYGAGDVLDDVVQGGYLVLLLDVQDTTRHLTMANNFYGPVKALQLVFQDANHHWPWHPDYQDGYLPILGLITDEMRAL